jgi:hypothetical protein
MLGSAIVLSIYVQHDGWFKVHNHDAVEFLQ